MTTEIENAERARIQAIIGCDAAKRAPRLAETLAFETALPAEAATAALEAAAADLADKPVPPVVAQPSAQRSRGGVGTPESTERRMGDDQARGSWSRAVANANRAPESLQGMARGPGPKEGWSRAIDMANQAVA